MRLFHLYFGRPSAGGKGGGGLARHKSCSRSIGLRRIGGGFEGGGFWPDTKPTNIFPDHTQKFICGGGDRRKKVDFLVQPRFSWQNVTAGPNLVIKVTAGRNIFEKMTFDSKFDHTQKCHLGRGGSAKKVDFLVQPRFSWQM